MKRNLLLLFMLCTFVGVKAQEISESDKSALIAFYNATNGPNWTNTWDLTDSPTNWFGVVTAVYFPGGGGPAERHVDEINLPNNNLVGTLPIELGNLKDLNTLDLSNNSITGAIPGALGGAEDLNYLYLQNNDLSGDIPIALFTSPDPHFVEIDLSFNQLTGKLPEEIGSSIPNVGSVFVSNNLLTDLPDYTNISLFRINTLDISNNNIYFSVFERVSSGFDNIAEVLEGNVSNLTYQTQNKINTVDTVSILEGENTTFAITGLISTNNTYQWFKNNSPISGATNSTYQVTAADLTDEGVYYCEIKNTEVPNLTLVRNDITLNVTVPVTDRNSLIAIYNAADGPNWTNPWDLSADISTWEGVTVDAVSGRVTELVLNQRKLNGTLADEIGNLTELVKLSFFGGLESNLTGSIPTSICNLTKLEDISISQVEFSGAIPSCLFTITSLNRIFISGSSTPILTLDLPDDLSALTNLRTLYLQRVDLSSEGAFPLNALQLINLEELTLDINRLTGTIPPEIAGLSNLTILSISGNNITGSIPDEIALLTNLTQLRLSNLNLTGVLPSSIGNLTNLTQLTVFGTDIEGEIPASYSNLTSLLFLTLARNNLSGQIPDFISTFTNLVRLELRENKNLSGPVPNLTGLANLTEFTFQDNQFVFDDFENEFSSYQTSITTRFTYQPQADIDLEQTLTVTEEDPVTFTVEATQSPNNIYQWRKDGINIVGATNRTYTINNVAITDAGIYDCLVTNTIITDLSLLKRQTTLAVTPLDGDNDGVNDDVDLCLNTPNGETVNANGCSQSQLDDDNDGVFNNLDLCPNTPDGETVNTDGCSQSQLDDDNDGVFNSLDLCPNTPDGETVNTDGCSQSQLDDDNDGVFNSLDLCANTPDGETVNADGCSESQLDDDNDGVFNNLDLCDNTPDGEAVNADGCSESQLDDDNDGVTNNLDLCANTPNGETVNANGCSESQLDDDNDGVTNNLDECPNTTPGSIVNATGCSDEALLNLSQNDIRVVATSTSCVETANGELQVLLEKDFTYTITVSSATFNQTFDNVNSTADLFIDSLAAGTYIVCIKIPEFPNFEQCFNAIVLTPEDLVTGKATVDTKTKKAIIPVSGSAYYEVTVNNKTTEFNFDNTGLNKIALSLQDGKNDITIKTDKVCQGIYEESILINDMRFYPNPVTDFVYLVGMNNFETANIIVTDLTGNVVLTTTKNQLTDNQLPMRNLAVGVYIISVQTETQILNTKIYKK
ncbi:immunoglobulin domain-containing protein [Spongiivirga citrea]|uniref:T9SS type A sorting domain-containing protein n=1 Tax=Spongiivirga citrea TaxID=1481457 RepID=A0A6M0CJH3_9FLAO|nr:immunoglobulin domain-containing protein [Spongiivirga citrea]NER18076.1 T9SS type A sorting domain-containing protein [Spongiivirga citrea]